MIRLSANLSKKVPLPGIDYSSQQFGASMEIEVSDVDKSEVIQARIRDLYAMLSAAIDEQIVGPKPTVSTLPTSVPRNGNGNGNGYSNRRNGTASSNGRKVTATEAQCRAIAAICKSNGQDIDAVLADYNVTRVEELNIRDASRLIDDLKSRKNTQPH